MRRVLLAAVVVAGAWLPIGVAHAFETPSQTGSSTAQCVDGMFSDSQSRSGTCSSHRGVAHFLGALATPAQGGPCPLSGCKTVGSGDPDPNYGATATSVPTTYATIAPPTVPPTTPALSTALPSTSSATVTPARTGRNEHLMIVVAALVIALGTLALTVTPSPGRHAQR